MKTIATPSGANSPSPDGDAGRPRETTRNEKRPVRVRRPKASHRTGRLRGGTDPPTIDLPAIACARPPIARRSRGFGGRCPFPRSRPTRLPGPADLPVHRSARPSPPSRLPAAAARPGTDRRVECPARLPGPTSPPGRISPSPLPLPPRAPGSIASTRWTPGGVLPSGTCRSSGAGRRALTGDEDTLHPAFAQVKRHFSSHRVIHEGSRRSPGTPSSSTASPHGDPQVVHMPARPG